MFAGDFKSWDFILNYFLANPQKRKTGHFVAIRFDFVQRGFTATVHDSLHSLSTVVFYVLTILLTTLCRSTDRGPVLWGRRGNMKKKNRFLRDPITRRGRNENAYIIIITGTRRQFFFWEDATLLAKYTAKVGFTCSFFFFFLNS